MKKLTVALVLVALLTLPMVGLADSPGQGQGNEDAPALVNADRVIFFASQMCGGKNVIGGIFVMYLYCCGVSPGWNK